MSDVDDKPADNSGEPEDATPIGGERLAEARRAMQIPVVEIAKELHLDEYKVRALEQNEFDVLGAPVFAKGHLRKYAQLVDVDEADVMADYYQLNREPSAPLVVSIKPAPKPEFSPGPWIAGVIAVVLAGLAYWWFVERTPAVPPREQSSSVVTLPESSPVTTSEEEATEQSQDNQPLAAVEEDDATAIADVEAPVQRDPEPEPVVGQLSLSVTYSGDCWTEISDARGRRLFFDLGTAGRTVNLSGEAPLNVLFGDADNVSIEVNGMPFTIPPANRRGKTARLTLAGS